MNTQTPGDTERYIALARIALRHYNLVDPAVEILRFSDNLTRRVIAAGRALLAGEPFLAQL